MRLLAPAFIVAAIPLLSDELGVGSARPLFFAPLSGGTQVPGWIQGQEKGAGPAKTRMVPRKARPVWKDAAGTGEIRLQQ